VQAAEFYKYLKNPSTIDKSVVPELQQMVKDFPYFQSAHLLLSLASKKWDTSVYQQSLKKTAIVVSNRAHLFKLIHNLENLQSEPVIEVQQTDVDLPTPVEQAHQELDILKAAEVSVETAPQEEIKKPIEPEVLFEREIQKEVVQSFVEKEILKTQELNKPLVPAETPESFGDWLSFLKKNNGQPYQEIEKEVDKAKVRLENKQAEVVKPDVQISQSRKLRNKAIIDKIIDKNPGLIRTKEEQKFYTPDMKAKESLLENEHLVTETLARIYALQGSVNKAVRAYEILSLKYPQKSAYFASLIEKLKNNQ